MLQHSHVTEWLWSKYSKGKVCWFQVFNFIISFYAATAA